MATNKINNRIYIGKTIFKLQRRISGHANASCNQNSKTYFHRAIRKYGIHNFEWKILCETDNLSKLNVLEKFYIMTFKKIHNLYNLTIGGDGVSMPGKSNPFYGKKHSEKTKKHWSKIRKGIKNKNMSRDQKGEKNSFYGKKHSIETKTKISQSRIGKNFGVKGENHPHFNRIGLLHPCSKSIYQIDKYTNKIIKQWESIRQAEIHLKIRHISDVCHKKLKTAGGFKWEFSKKF